MAEFPMRIELDDMKMRTDEWELAGYRILNRTPQIAAVIMDGEQLAACYLRYDDCWGLQPNEPGKK